MDYRYREESGIFPGKNQMNPEGRGTEEKTPGTTEEMLEDLFVMAEMLDTMYQYFLAISVGAYCPVVLREHSKNMIRSADRILEKWEERQMMPPPLR